MVTEPLPIVEVRGASITFPGVKALDEVDFRLLPGEVHTLMGENGAGKSTLIKALTGVYQIDSGSILVFGEKRRFSGTASAQAAGISTVYQEVNLCTNLTIGENVMLGHEERGWAGINWKKTNERAHDALAERGHEVELYLRSAGHNWVNWRNGLADGLRFALGGKGSRA